MLDEMAGVFAGGGGSGLERVREVRGPKHRNGAGNTAVWEWMRSMPRGRQGRVRGMTLRNLRFRRAAGPAGRQEKCVSPGPGRRITGAQ